MMLAPILLIAWIGAPGAIETQAPPAPPQAAPPSGEGYTYESEGRRDPFLNPIGRGTEPQVSSKRADGPAGMTASEITVRGVMQSRGAMVAMIQGPDSKTYIVHQGDKLLDGTIKSINQQGLVISQEVNDPLSIVKQRDIRKTLRSAEGGRE
jgi:Tfp pilus assembly protein PilP